MYDVILYNLRICVTCEVREEKRREEKRGEERRGEEKRGEEKRERTRREERTTQTEPECVRVRLWGLGGPGQRYCAAEVGLGASCLCAERDKIKLG